MKNKIFSFVTLIAILGFSAVSGAQYRPTSPSIKSPMAPVAFRPYTVGLEGGFSSLSTSPGTGSTTRVELEGFFGWNLMTFEVGPKLYFTTVSGNSSSNSFGVGGYGDYNLVPNRIGEKFVYGVTGDLLVGSSSSSGTSSSRTAFSMGGVGKWYFASTSTSALRMSFVYSNDKTGSSTTSGFKFIAGLQTYF